MVELGQLEQRYDEFAKRHVRVAAISDDDQPVAQATQADFPHLVIIADPERKMGSALHVIHAGAGQAGKDTNAPTTFLVDGTGKVRWLKRPDRFIARLSPDEVLRAVDEAHLEIKSPGAGE